MREIVFTADFATKKAGEEWDCDSLLASYLVHVDQVAIYRNPMPKGKKFANPNPEE